MLTRSAHGLLVAATALFTLGLATANPVVLSLTALPLTAFILGAFEATPTLDGAVIRASGQARAGDVLDIDVVITTSGPAGVVAIRLHLPPEFDLVSGTNTHLIRTAKGRQEHTRSLRVRAAKRGRFQLGPVEASPLSLAGLRAPPSETLGAPSDLEVHPGLIPVRRLRAMRGTAATIAPNEDIGRVGLKTTDFRELREYRWGDPPRSVNWKATARHGPAIDMPLVNEYEVEGRKAVWFFLDAGAHMAVGTSVENGFEVAIQAASGLALAYLDRGYRIGMYAYNAEGVEPLYPEVGQKQFLKIQRLLARLEPAPADEGALEAVMRCRSWLVASSPMVIFITRTEVGTEQLEAALRRLRALTPNRKRPMIVLEPQAFHLVPGGESTKATARLLDHLARTRHQRLRRLGALVLPWNPETESLERLLFRGVISRG